MSEERKGKVSIPDGLPTLLPQSDRPCSSQSSFMFQSRMGFPHFFHRHSHLVPLPGLEFQSRMGFPHFFHQFRTILGHSFLLVSIPDGLPTLLPRHRSDEVSISRQFQSRMGFPHFFHRHGTGTRENRRGVQSRMGFPHFFHVCQLLGGGSRLSVSIPDGLPTLLPLSSLVPSFLIQTNVSIPDGLPTLLPQRVARMALEGAPNSVLRGRAFLWFIFPPLKLQKKLCTLSIRSRSVARL